MQTPTVGAMNFFASFADEGSRGVIGPYLGLQGAGALAISTATGVCELLLGDGIRLLSGPGPHRGRVRGYYSIQGLASRGAGGAQWLRPRRRRGW